VSPRRHICLQLSDVELRASLLFPGANSERGCLEFGMSARCYRNEALGAQFGSLMGNAGKWLGLNKFLPILGRVLSHGVVFHASPYMTHAFGDRDRDLDRRRV